MGFVTKNNLLDRFKTFREQNDERYLRELNPASSNRLGGIKVGYGLKIDKNGVLSVALSDTNTSSGGSSDGDSDTVSISGDELSLWGGGSSDTNTSSGGSSGGDSDTVSISGEDLSLWGGGM